MGLAYWPDIRHDTPDAVSGPTYGKPVCYMKRARRSLTLRTSFSRLARLARIFMWEITTLTIWLRYGGGMYDDRP